LLREQWGRVRGVYAIDHFLPVARHPGLLTDHDNLLYACATCNAAKGDRELPDPLVVLTGSSVSMADDGTIHTQTPEAARLVEILGLDSAQSTEFRLLWIGIVALAAQHAPELYQRLRSYPDDLPDLRKLQPPSGNSRPAGVEESALARRERGELPTTY
jgi:hypothetical protein